MYPVFVGYDNIPKIRIVLYVLSFWHTVLVFSGLKDFSRNIRCGQFLHKLRSLGEGIIVVLL